MITNAVDVVFVMNELFYVDNYFMLDKMGYQGLLFDMDYLIKHKVKWENIYRIDFEQVDLKDDKLFGYELSDIQYKRILPVKMLWQQLCTNQLSNFSYFFKLPCL